MITDFTGEWAALSNFHPSPVTFDGLTFSTVEHAFQAAKTVDPVQRQEIQRAATPRDAKNLGRTITLRPGWDAYLKQGVMFTLLHEKFHRPPERDVLLATGDRPIVEGNGWHDQVWGDCRCGRPECGPDGLNLLGRMLMDVRATLSPTG